MRYQIRHAIVKYAADTILEDVNFEIHDHEKIAIIGRNGCGKTTLLKLISGVVEMANPDSDEECGIVMAGKQRIGYLRQISFEDSSITVEEEILKVFAPVFSCEKRMQELTEQMKTDTSEHLLKEYATLQAKMEALRGYTYRQDMETMFQMNYLYFTNIKKDEQAFNSLINQYRAALKNKSLSAESALQDSVTYTLHAHDARQISLEEKDLDNANYDRILQIAKERTANAADFTFTIVGNFDETLVRQYIETYIASLPSVKKGKKFVHENFNKISKYATGTVDNTFHRKMETPKSNIYMFWYNNTVPFTLDNSIKADAAGQVLDMVYLKTIREEQSAAYSANAGGFANLGNDVPFNAIYGYCPVKPEKKDIAIKIMREELQKLGSTIDADMLNKTKDLMVKRYEDGLKTNGYWMNVIQTWDEEGVDINTDYEKLVNALTPASVAKYVKDNFIGKNSVSVIMLPQE